MLFALGHGQHIIMAPERQTENSVPQPGTIALAAVAPGARESERMTEAGLSGGDMQSFGYYFPNAGGTLGSDRATVDALKAIAAAMVETDGDPEGENSTIPPVFTYFGQFIDHDTTANTDRDAPDGDPISDMTGPSVTPLPRKEVVKKIINLRNGTLRLDSLYGEGPQDTPFTAKLRDAMRDPADRGRMRLGTTFPVGATVELPLDGFSDLPRLGDVVADPQSGLTLADLEALPPGPFKDGFVKGGVVNQQRALIGDGRNDENLVVAQVHMSFLRLHNAIAEDLKTKLPDAEARFKEAKKRTTWAYQWLVVNQFLERVCDTAVVAAVKAAEAPLYAEFRQRVGANFSDLPLPLNFPPRPTASVIRWCAGSMISTATSRPRPSGRSSPSPAAT